MKTNRILCLLVALLLLLPLISCAKRDPNIPEGFLLAENDGDYYFYYPETWILEENGRGLVSVRVSDSDFSNVNVATYTASNEYPTLADYIEKHFFTQFEGNFSNLTYEKNEDETPRFKILTVDGCDALSVEYAAAFAGEEYRFRSCVISMGGYLTVITYTAKTEQYSKHLDAIDMIISNFQFK